MYAMKPKLDNDVIHSGSLPFLDERDLYYTGVVSVEQGTELASLPGESQIVDIKANGQCDSGYIDLIVICRILFHSNTSNSKPSVLNYVLLLEPSVHITIEKFNVILALAKQVFPAQDQILIENYELREELASGLIRACD